MIPSRLVTIKDVAKEAGVSIGAVSKVLHGRGGNIRVSEATAQRIRDAARALSYRPNYHARSLRSGRSRSVGIVTGSSWQTSNRGMLHTHVLERLVAILHAKEYTLNLAPELMPLADLQGLSDGRFDGLVWLDAVLAGPLVEAFFASPVPVVAIGGIFEAVPERGALFLVDEDASQRTLLAHLVEFGHRNVLYSDRGAELHDPLGERRVVALIENAKRLGVTITVQKSAEAPEAIAKWQAITPRPTAIVSYSDQRGALMMQEAQRLGISVPEDVSIAAFDGSPLTLWAWPRLTSIRPPAELLAERASDHLILQMERQPAEPVLERYAATLDVAGSTGPAS